MKRPGEMSYGFASNLRAALPNASFISFTGTPIEKTDTNTQAVFGDFLRSRGIAWRGARLACPLESVRNPG